MNGRRWPAVPGIGLDRMRGLYRYGRRQCRRCMTVAHGAQPAIAAIARGAVHDARMVTGVVAGVGRHLMASRDSGARRPDMCDHARIHRHATTGRRARDRGLAHIYKGQQQYQICLTTLHDHRV